MHQSDSSDEAGAGRRWLLVGGANSGGGSFPGGQPQKAAPTQAKAPLTGGASPKMLGRLAGL